MGLGAAKKACLEVKKHEFELEIEKEIAAAAKNKCSKRPTDPTRRLEEEDSSYEENGGRFAKEIVRQIQEKAALVEEVDV